MSTKVSCGQKVFVVYSNTHLNWRKIDASHIPKGHRENGTLGDTFFHVLLDYALHRIF